MDFLKRLSTSEKLMLGGIVVMLVMVALSWGRISDGFKKAVTPYHKEQAK